MKEQLGENEWRRRMILAARKVQLATQTFAEDVAAIRDVRPGMERLEGALRDSHKKLERLESRLLEEVLRRIEEREHRGPATGANSKARAAPGSRTRSPKCSRPIRRTSSALSS